MTVRLSDLSPAARKKLRLDAPKRKRAKGGGTTACQGWCVACGERFETGAAWERHSDATGHRRLQCVPQPRSIRP